MTFYETYSASNEAHMFLFTFLRNGSASQRTNRLRNRVLSKALSSTPDARARDEGIPNPWFTGPPNFKNKEVKVYGAFNDGRVRWTYPPTAPPKKLLKIINNLFTFCSNCYKIVRRYPNSPQKYKHFMRFGY